MQPDPYNRLTRFTGTEAGKPTATLGVNLDKEFDEARLTVEQIRANLELIQRDDTKLANKSVHAEALDDVVMALLDQGAFSFNGSWAVAKSLAVGNIVEYGNALYVALSAHVAVDFAADLAAKKIIGPIFDPDQISMLKSDLASATGSSLIGYSDGGVGAQTVTVQDKLRWIVTPEDYGAVGAGGVSDDAAFASAAAAASARGVPLVCSGTKTYTFTGTTWTLPTGLVLYTNGAVFQFTQNVTSSDPAISGVGPIRMDDLYVRIPSGVVRRLGVYLTGDNVTTGRITVAADDKQAQGSNSEDYAVKLASGARFEVAKIVVTNFNRAVVTEYTTDSKIGGLDVTNYLRGYYGKGDTNLYIGKSNIKGRSPDATNSPGHNGVLLGNAGGTNNTFEDFTVEDAAEEGIRIAGGPQRNVHLVRPRVRNADANGIKVLGTSNTTPVLANYQQALFITNPIVEDCGYNGGSDDRNGILIQRSTGVQVSNPIVRRRAAETTAGSFVPTRVYKIVSVGTTDFTAIGASANTVGTVFTATGAGSGTGTAISFAAVNGILISGSSDVTITGPIIQNTQWSGIRIMGTVGTAADVSNVNIIGGMVSDCGQAGIRVTSTGATLSNIHITGIKSFNNGQMGADIGGTGTFVNCVLNATIDGNAQQSVNVGSNEWTLDCYGYEAAGSSPTSFASISAKDGSRWSNTVTLYIRKAGAWVAL